MTTERYFVRLDAARPTVGHMVGDTLVEAPGSYCERHDLIYPQASASCPLCRQEMVRTWRATQAMSRRLSQTEGRPAPMLGVLLVGASVGTVLFCAVKLIGAWL